MYNFLSKQKEGKKIAKVFLADLKLDVFAKVAFFSFGFLNI